MDTSAALAFPCVPPCIECRRAGLCNKPVESFAHGETVQTRKRSDPHAGIVVLPCGCWGLPWPLVHKLGENFDSIFCDRHGWLKITEAKKKKMKIDADRMMKPDYVQTTMPLDEEPPF